MQRMRTGHGDVPAAAVGGRSPQHTLLAFVVTTLLFLAVSYFVLCPPTRLSRRLQRTANRWYAAVLGRVPLPPSLQTPADLVIAARSFSHYANAQQRWIGRKWLAFERMPARQRTYGDQLGWRDVLRKSEDAVELNSVVTDELAALAFAQARRDGVPIGLRSQFWRENGRVVEVGPPRRLPPFPRLDVALNIALQIVFWASDSQAFRPGLERRWAERTRGALPAHSRGARAGIRQPGAAKGPPSGLRTRKAGLRDRRKRCSECRDNANCEERC